MTNQKLKTPVIDLSNLEKFIFNSVFSIILVYIFLIGNYRQLLAIRELNNSAAIISFILIFVLFLSRLASYQNKSAFECGDGEDNWIFFKRSKKIYFETNGISLIKKSFWGLYSSFLLVLGNKKLRIPAESQNLMPFIQSLSHRLTKEQIVDFMQFHKRAVFVSFEIEKAARFLKYFCFFIAPVSFFIALKVWEFESFIICIVWSVFSIIYSIFWSFVHYFLLIVSVTSSFAIFQRITAIWALLGVFLYMFIGISFRNFYFTLIYR